MHSYEDHAKLHSAFSATMLSYASHFRQKQGVMENLEYFVERYFKMLALLRFVSIIG